MKPQGTASRAAAPGRDGKPPASANPLLYYSKFVTRIVGAGLITAYLHTSLGDQLELASPFNVTGVVTVYVLAVLAIMLLARGERFGTGLQRAMVISDLALLSSLLPSDSHARLPATFFYYLAFIDYGLRFGIRRYVEAFAAALTLLSLQILWRAHFSISLLGQEDAWTLLLFAMICGCGLILLYERERTSLRLHGFEFSQRMAAEVAGIGSYEANLLAEKVHWDEQMHSLFGISVGQFSGRYADIFSRIHADDLPYVYREIWAGVTNNMPIDIACRVIWPDTTVHMLATRSQVVRDRLKVPHMIGMAWDITDTMRARDHARNLERWRTAATQAGGVIVWSYDPLTKAWEVDGDMAALLHAPVSTIGKDAAAVLKFLHPDDISKLQQAHERALQSGEYFAEFRIIGGDGHERWLHARGIAERTRSGQIMRLVGSAWNADDDVRQRLEAQAKQTELEHAYRELESFTHIAAHDIKEPLRGIRNYAQYLEEDYADRLDDAGRGMLARMAAQSGRLEVLINNLLEVSRVSWMPLQRQETDLDALVNEVLGTLEFLIDEQRVEVRRPRPLPRVQCDPVHVGEIYRNLITNAVKYNDKAAKWIEIDWQGREDAPILFVRDNGIGIGAAHFEEIFALFRRLHARDGFGGGSGIGLTIIKKIVERHSGRIWLESAVGTGTTFYFTLAPAVPAAVTEPSSQRHATG